MSKMQNQLINNCILRDVKTVDRACSVADALEIMRKSNIESLIVKDKDKIIGIFTEKDFFSKIDLKGNVSDSISENIIKFSKKDIVTFSSKESCRDAIATMQSNEINYALVVDDGNLVGAVSLFDLMNNYEKQLVESNIQLLEEKNKLSEKAVKLNTIIELEKKLVSDMEPKELLGHIASVARQLVNADTASVILFKEENGELTIAASEIMGNSQDKSIINPSLDQGQSITGWVIKNKEPLLLHGVANCDDRFKNIMSRDNIKSSICIPIVYRNEIKGTLNLSIVDSDYLFAEEDFQTAISLGNYVAVAIENNNMYKDLQSMYLRCLRVANERMNRMNEELRVAHEKIDDEIKTVAIVQQGLLPASLPQDKKVDVAAIYSASTTVGGDYYDCIRMEDGRLAIVMADVTGHGLPAAFVMTMIKILLFYLNQQGVSLDSTVSTINDMLSCHVPISTFPSLVYGILNPEDRTLTYINAGHEPILRINHSKKTKELYYAQSSLLGIEKGTKFEMSTITMEKGDKLLLYTDGIPDAMNKKKEFFSREKFIEIAYKNIKKNPREVIDAIMKELNVFTEGNAFADDVTLMVLGF